MWYLKTLSDYANKLEKVNSDYTRQDMTLVDWSDAIEPLLLFMRVIPEKEADLFN